MALLIDGHGRDLMLLGFRNGHLHGARGDHVAKPPVAVDPSTGRGLTLNRDGRARHNVPSFDAGDIRRQQDHAVGVMPGQVRPYQVLHDELRFLCGRASGQK